MIELTCRTFRSRTGAYSLVVTQGHYHGLVEPTGHDRRVQSRERVIETATRLFAALGYDATPIAAVADACGVDVPAITGLVGDKQTLYRLVMDRVNAQQRAAFDVIIAEFTPDRAGLHRLVDRALDHLVAHPELAALWMHRWHSDAADIPEMESVYLGPVLARIRAVIREVAPAKVDVNLALQTIAWTIRGFCVGGVINDQGEREGSESPILLERFRQHLHRITDQMFELDRQH
jgi:AcrR family transcriptional regulator